MLEPLDFMRRLAAHVSPQAAGTGALGAAHQDPPDPPTSARRRTPLPWAQLLRRVFFFDALKCPRCAAVMVILAFLSDPPAVAKILRHLRLPTTPTPLAPARGAARTGVWDLRAPLPVPPDEPTAEVTAAAPPRPWLIPAIPALSILVWGRLRIGTRTRGDEVDPRRIVFAAMDWESPLHGVRHKSVTCGGRRVRLVEYTRAMEPHWCERGHFGYIVSGMFEVEFADTTVVYKSGDGVSLPAGHEHRHRARVVSETVRAVFVEDA